MREIFLRALVGGLIVSAFALLGDLFKPKRFAGLFGAAPSVALATIGLTVASKEKEYAAIEARSMLAGTAAFFVYACCVCWVMMRIKPPAKLVTLAAMPVWFGTAFGIWWMWLR